MANIGIVGYGIVGKSVDYGLRRDNENIFFYDKFKEEDNIKGIRRKCLPLKDVVEKSEFIFVCLPTPFSESGQSIDLTIMDEAIDEIAKLTESTNKIIVIKSTVVPGTTRKYSEKYPNCKFCFNPEFLVEASYLQDAINPDRIIIGADSHNIRLKINGLYRSTFPEVPIHLTDLTTAEASKYMANAFLSTKVIFANEIYDLCEKLDINYEEIRKMVISDRRIGESHLDVTSFRGFGGKCLPKDIIAFISLFDSLGVDVSLLKTVWEKNLKIRKVKDWEDIPFVKSE